MYGSKNGQQGSRDGERGKKSGGPKHTASSHSPSKKTGHSGDKVGAPFQPVLLRHQEPRAKPSEETTQQHGNVGSQPSLTEKSAPTILHKPPTSSPHTPTIAVQTDAPPAHAKQPQRMERRTGGGPQATPDSASLSKIPASPHRGKTPESKSPEPITPQEPKVSLSSLKSSVFQLIGESNQYQALLSDEIKSFLEHTVDLFPSATSTTNWGEVSVIGVMGGANTGKSTLLNAIASKCGPVLQQAALSVDKPLKEAPKTQPMSILAELRHWRDNNPSAAPPALTFTPFTVNTLNSSAKSLLSQSKSSFSIEMTLVKRAGGLGDKTGMSGRTNPSDCIILLESTCLPTASMIVQGKKSEQTLTSDVRTQENLVQMTSLQIGLFMLSVCNVLVFVDDSTCRVSNWKYLKTLEMMKWNIPELSELYFGSPVMSVLIAQRNASFQDARQRDTYEKMMLDMVSRAGNDGNSKNVPLESSSASRNDDMPIKKSKQGGKRQRKQRKQREGTNTAELDLTFDENKVSALSGALDAIHLYSPDQEYLPSLFFAFNKLSSSCTSTTHAERVSKAIRTFFDQSRFLHPDLGSSPTIKSSSGGVTSTQDESTKTTSSTGRGDELKNRSADASSQSLGSLSIPFIAISSQPGVVIGPSSSSSEISMGACRIEEFSHSVLALPSPRFKKPMNPREWLVGANWMWELIKHSPSLAQYNAVLKVGTSRALGASSSSTSTSLSPLSSTPAPSLSPSSSSAATYSGAST